MLIDVQSLTRGQATFMDLDLTMASGDVPVSYQGNALSGRTTFKGRLVAGKEGVFTLEGVLSAALEGPCSRCLKQVRRALTIRVRETFRPGVEQGAHASDGSYQYRGFMIDLIPALRDDLVLAMPIQLLCRPDCKGLCPDCGADLNETTCHCAELRVLSESPFSKLKEWL